MSCIRPRCKDPRKSIHVVSAVGDVYPCAEVYPLPDGQAFRDLIGDEFGSLSLLNHSLDEILSGPAMKRLEASWNESPLKICSEKCGSGDLVQKNDRSFTTFAIENKEQKHFCILPFVHTAIEANGDVKACCLTPAFKRTDGQSFNLNRDSWSEVLSSEDYRQFIESFQNGKRHPYCGQCWRLDDSGGLSNRRLWNKMVAEKMPDVEFKSPQRDLRFLEIKLGNKCNLKCRICGPINSSPAAAETASITGDPSYLNFTRDAAWIQNNEIWRQLAKTKIELIHLMGGEPFLDRSHIQLLEHLVRSERAKDVTIWYNSNATIWPAELIPWLEQFKSVHLSLSVDDIGQRFEYQRYPANWEKVKANLKRFVAHPLFSKQVFLDVCWSLFNIYYIDEILDFFEYQMADTPFISHIRSGRHLYAGEEFSPQCLRPHQRLRFLDRIRSSPRAERPLDRGLYDWLAQHLSVDRFSQRAEVTRHLKLQRSDRFRGQDFLTTFPELNFLAPPSQKDSGDDQVWPPPQL